MLKRTNTAPNQVESTRAPEQNPESAFPAIAIGLMRRQWPLIAAIVSVICCLGITYILMTPRQYQAKAYLLLDTKKLNLNLYQNQYSLGEESIPDFGAVDSQMEVLRSEAIARSVVDELKLDQDPEATGRNLTSFFTSLTGAVWRLFGPDPNRELGNAPVLSNADLAQAAVGFVRGNLQVQRVRMTYVVEIAFQSLDPGKAGRIANAICEAYILDQTQSKQSVTKRAVTWLQQRMTELREQAIEADRAVQDYKTKNNIVTTGKGTVDEQQLSELTSQSIIAKSQTADAKAKVDQIRSVIAAGSADAILSDGFRSDVISKLRQQYVEMSRRYVEYSARFGKDHQAVQNLRLDLQRILTAATEELKRVAQGLEGEYEVAKSREQSLQLRLKALTEQDAETRQGQGALQALESAAKAYRTLHESFLQRYVEATQQQSIATTEARVLTPASGGSKIIPNNKMVLASTGVLGLLLGFGCAYARERLDAVFRTPKQVEQALGVQCLGVLPAIPPKAQTQKREPNAERLANRMIDDDLGIARQVVLTPFSRFTETIRSIKVAVDMGPSGHEGHLLGVVSAVPAEGKSTVCANLAQLTAHSGTNTLLVDADLRNPSLTRLLTPDAKAGLLDVLQGKAVLENVIWQDPITGLHFLPGILGAKMAHTSEILASKNMQELLNDVRERYDYVNVDLPPLGPVVDARAISHLMDGFLLVIEWGQTSPEAVAETLGSAELIQSKLIGAVLNRANPVAMKRLETYKGKYYHNYYTSYISEQS
jgi:succinoglycan biosynthesis transport protein ExoP